MALPSVVQIQVPIALTNLTLQYKPHYLIGEQVFPIVPVPAPATKVLKYSKANMFRLEPGELVRAEGSLTKRGNYNVDTQTVMPKQISYEMPVTDELLDISTMPGQMPLQPLIDAVQHIVTKIDNYKEKLIADTIFGATWADGSAGGVVPSGGAGAWALTTTANTMLKDIYNAKQTILALSGVLPNVLEIDHATYIATQNNPVIMDKIKYTQRGVTTAELLAELFQLDEVVIGRAIFTSQQETKAPSPAAFVGTSIWNQDGFGKAFLYHRAAPGLRVVSAGFQFRLPYMGSMRFMRGYRDEQVRSTVYQITENVEIAPVATDVGFVWKQTLVNPRA